MVEFVEKIVAVVEDGESDVENATNCGSVRLSEWRAAVYSA